MRIKEKISNPSIIIVNLENSRIKKPTKQELWWVVKIKLAALVEGYPKGLFSIATTPRCRGGDATHFPGFLHFTLDTYLIMLSVKQGGNTYHFLSLWY